MYKLPRITMILSKKQLFLFISTIVILIFCSYFFLDKNIAHYFIEHADTYKVFGKTASILGESHWYIGSAVLGALYYAFIQKNALYMQKFLFLLYANLFSGFISLILKLLFARLRPWKLENGGDAYGFLLTQNPDFSFLENIKYQFSILLADATPNTSFPSGHTTTMFVLFTYLSILFPRYIYLWLSFALFGAISRILANDHFLSDTLAGILVGTLATLFIYSKVKGKIEKNY